MSNRLLIAETNKPRRAKWITWDEVPPCRWVYCKSTGGFCLKGVDGNCLVCVGEMCGIVQCFTLHIPATEMRDDTLFHPPGKPKPHLYRLCKELTWKWCKEGLPVSIIEYPDGDTVRFVR